MQASMSAVWMIQLLSPCSKNVNPLGTRVLVLRMWTISVYWRMQSWKLFALSQFDDSTVIPEPLPQLELYQLLREALEDRAKCTAFVERWEQFKHFFPKVPDADEKKAFRSKMFGCASGQNRMNSAHRMSTPEEGDAVWFKSMERWSMTFWKLMPRVLARYCSEENQGRDGCSQTKLPAEQILKACDSRNQLIAWDNNHIRWSSLSPDSRASNVSRSCRWPDQINIIAFVIGDSMYFKHVLLSGDVMQFFDFGNILALNISQGTTLFTGIFTVIPFLSLPPWPVLLARNLSPCYNLI